MRVSFLIHRLNSLCFFLPLEEYLKKQGFDTTFIILKSNDLKYNSVNLPENQIEINKHIKSKTNYIELTQEELLKYETDVLFSLDVGGFPKCSKNDFGFKYIIIQNYSDFVFNCQYPKTEHAYRNCDAVWVHNNFYKNILKKDLLFDKKIITACLPCYWYYEDEDRKTIGKKTIGDYNPEWKYALCYLPRPTQTIMSSWKDVKTTPCDTFKTNNPLKNTKHYINFDKYLVEEKKYRVMWKQRRKNRNKGVDKLEYYTEDKCWMPSTALTLLFFTDFVWGYDTSAIMDASFFGTPYINITISKKPPIIEKIYEEYKNNEKYENTRFYDVSTPIKELDIPPDLRDTLFLQKQKSQINDAKERIVQFIQS